MPNRFFRFSFQSIVMMGLVFQAGALLRAQTSGALTMQEAVRKAADRYPSLRISEAEIRGAAAGIQLARTAYLPRMELIAGVNRATRNNVLGLLLPSQIIAPISGPVLNSNSLSSAWGSTVGVLVSWEPFDFGLRNANTEVARAAQGRAEAAAARTRLEIETLIADHFLTLLAGEQTVLAAQAASTRAAELQRITEALVSAELRPGVETSLARAEVASAELQVIRARQAVAEARTTLALLLGVPPATVEFSAAKLLSAPVVAQERTLEANPLVREAQAAINESEARLRVLDRSYFPRFTFQGTSYARGTGALPEGRLLGGVNGLGPNIQNWAAGFTVQFPLFDLPAIRARKQAESSRLTAEQERRRQVLLDLETRRGRAQAAYEAALQVAKTTPALSEAARAAVEQATARYQSGLGTAREVAESQRQLAQAEIDERLAVLGIWRARLAVLAAEGDISPLLTEASQ
jgi:outer membrane protein